MRRTLLFLSILLIITLEQAALAQQRSQGETTSSSAAQITYYQSSSASIQKYGIWPGDVLDVRVFAHPELSAQATVSASGTIRLPRLAEEIQAACRTEAELQREVAERYKPQGNYQILIRVKESKAPPVIVKGAVSMARSLQLLRRVRLIDALAVAGGTTERASGEIRIERLKAPACGQEAKPSEEVVYLADLKRGDESANPFIEPGDVITVVEAARIYVDGAVRRPSIIKIVRPLTITQAINAAGGTLPRAIEERVAVCRQINEGNEVKIINVDLKRARKDSSQDILLQADDAIYVPMGGGIVKGIYPCRPNKKSAPVQIAPPRPIY